MRETAAHGPATDGSRNFYRHRSRSRCIPTHNDRVMDLVRRYSTLSASHLWSYPPPHHASSFKRAKPLCRFLEGAWVASDGNQAPEDASASSTDSWSGARSETSALEGLFAERSHRCLTHGYKCPNSLRSRPQFLVDAGGVNNGQLRSLIKSRRGFVEETPEGSEEARKGRSEFTCSMHARLEH